MPISTALLPADLPAAHELLRVALDTALTGFMLFRPQYAADGSGTLTDFTYEYLNPAAQRMLHLPERPAASLLSLYPSAQQAGIFAFYRDTFLADAPGHYEVHYASEGLDSFFQLAARRNGELLLVSFDDNADLERGAAEQALQASQAREQAARAEAEAGRAELQSVFEQAPVAIAILRGPEYVIELANKQMGDIWGRPLGQLIGRPHFQALPDLTGQGFEAVFETVLRTARSYYLQEQAVRLNQDGQPYEGYFNITYQPAHDGRGQVTGIIASATEVTTQVLARQQTQNLNEELAVINEELRATNEEFLRNNAELTQTQLELQQLNQELETRVLARTAEARAARAEAERERRQFEQLLLRAPASICIFDGPNWVYSFVNPGYQRMFYGRQLLGRPLLEALPEVAGTPLEKILHHVYDTGETYEGSEVLVPLARTEDGPIEDLYFDLTYQARYNDEGQIDGFVTYAYEVTEQVLARRERQAQQQRLHELFEQAPVAIAVYRGPRYVIELANPTMCAIWGRTPAQAVGTPLFELLPEIVEQGFRELLDEVVMTGQPFVAHELSSQLERYGRRDTVYWNFVFEPVRDEHGQVGGVTCVAHDVTEQVLARRQVQTLNDSLQAANEELQGTNSQLTRTNVDLDNFIYTASHDLRQPIANIEGLLLALLAQLPPSAQADALVAPILSRMQGAIDRFKRTIADLTEVSKLQQAHDQPARPVHLAEVLREVQLDLAPQLLEAQAQLEVNLHDCATVLISEKNLRSIVYNLLSNALKYRDPARPLLVRVGCAPAGPQVALSVEDNGLGLDERQQGRLFGMFQRLHTHTEGTGIGLYMVKKIVENAGGTITVRSQPEVGSTFTVTLPR